MKKWKTNLAALVAGICWAIPCGAALFQFEVEPFYADTMM